MKKLLAENPLFIFALASEAANEFEGEDILYVGVGKVNATYQLTKRIGENKPSIIINLGSAGSNKFSRGSVVCCTRFIQRDMDATMIGCEKYETPYSNEAIILEYGFDISFLEKGICGTGDNFEVKHEASMYDVIDMEAYALAKVAQQEDIPFLCLKYISDGADNNAADDWNLTVHEAAKALRQTLNRIIQG